MDDTEEEDDEDQQTTGMIKQTNDASQLIGHDNKEEKAVPQFNKDSDVLDMIRHFNDKTMFNSKEVQTLLRKQKLQIFN